MLAGRETSRADYHGTSDLTILLESLPICARMAPMDLLLFDIDGTLLDTGGVGRDALQEGLRLAFPEQSAKWAMPSLELAGATDRGVTRFLFTRFAIPLTTENEQTFLSAYLEILRERLSPSNQAIPGTVLPGVLALLKALRSHHGPRTIALLTGNIRGGAEAKTSAYGLAAFFDFDCGAYGCDHWDRNALGPVAIERTAKQHGHDLRGNRVTIIGDTPKDIACGKAAGARTVAVATGRYSVEELAEHQPDHLLTDFTDLASTVSILTGAMR